MILVTHRFFWIPLYLVLVILLIIEFKKKSILLLVFIGLLVATTDRISSGIIKPTVKRLRPCHDPTISAQLTLANGCGGQYGYVSSHAANSFGIALFFYLLGGRKKKWLAWLFPWALVVSYSRIYLGVHYPGDIISGGILGILIAYFYYKLYLHFDTKYFSKYEL